MGLSRRNKLKDAQGQSKHNRVETSDEVMPNGEIVPSKETEVGKSMM